MINNIFFITLLTLPMFTYANYEMHMPLEVQNGGHLNQNSIIFSKKDITIPEIEYTKICRSMSSTAGFFWRETLSLGKSAIFWNGVSVGSGILNEETSYTTPDGTIYRKDAYDSTHISGNLVYYGVCQYIEKK